jgi:hypothetical protein
MNAAMNISVQERLLKTILRQLSLFHTLPTDHLEIESNEIISPIDAFHPFLSLKCFIKESIALGPVFTNHRATKAYEGMKT